MPARTYLATQENKRCFDAQLLVKLINKYLLKYLKEKLEEDGKTLAKLLKSHYHRYCKPNLYYELKDLLIDGNVKEKLLDTTAICSLIKGYRIEYYNEDVETLKETRNKIQHGVIMGRKEYTTLFNEAKKPLINLGCQDANIKALEPQLLYKLPKRISNFIGRSDHTEMLNNVLKPKNYMANSKSMVITGKSGIGKSALAAEYCHSSTISTDLYSHILYIDGHSCETVEESFKNIVKLLEENNFDNILDIPTYLINYLKGERVLLVYDNVKDKDVVNKSLLNVSHTIITTQIDDWNGDDYEEIKMECWEENEALDYLKPFLNEHSKIEAHLEELEKEKKTADARRGYNESNVKDLSQKLQDNKGTANKSKKQKGSSKSKSQRTLQKQETRLKDLQKEQKEADFKSEKNVKEEEDLKKRKIQIEKKLKELAQKLKLNPMAIEHAVSYMKESKFETEKKESSQRNKESKLVESDINSYISLLKEGENQISSFVLTIKEFKGDDDIFRFLLKMCNSDENVFNEDAVNIFTGEKQWRFFRVKEILRDYSIIKCEEYDSEIEGYPTKYITINELFKQAFRYVNRQTS